MAIVYRPFLEKLGGTEVSEYVGSEGELFYDPTTSTLRISDGTTSGGQTVISANTFSGTLTGNVVKDSDENFTISVVNTISGNSQWTFGSSGNLTLPGGLSSPLFTVGQENEAVVFYTPADKFFEIGSDFAAKRWKFNINGNLQFPVSDVPASSVGVAGDKKGEFALSNTHIYFCTANYNGGNIWVRVAWDDTGSWS